MRLVRPLLLAATLALTFAGACGKSKPILGDGGAAGTGGGGVGGDAGPIVDGGPETAPPTDGGLVPCLDQPGLQLPPSGGLPCELLPPGFGK